MIKDSSKGNAKISAKETCEILDQILETYSDIELTSEQYEDLVVYGMSSVIDRPDVVHIKGYVKGTLINCLKDQIKEKMHKNI